MIINPLYVLAAVMPTCARAGRFYRYQMFKEKQGYASGELKGNSLLAQRNYDAVEAFIKELVGKLPSRAA